MLLLLCCFFAPVHALDREAFSITSYHLNALIEPEQQRLAVRGTISLRNDSESAQKNAVLQISSSLNWISIQLDKKPLPYSTQPYVSDLDHTGSLSEALVVLPTAVGPRQTTQLEIAYEGTVPLDTTRLTRIGVPSETAKSSDWDEVGRNFTALRGIGYVTWYPIATQAASLSEGDEVPATIGRWKQRESGAEMRVQISVRTAPAAGLLRVLCNALRSSATRQELGSTISDAECDFPSLERAVPLIVVGEYQATEHAGIKIFYLPQHKAGADDYMLALDQAGAVVRDWFGEHPATHSASPQVIDLPADSAAFETAESLLMPLTENETGLLLAAVRQLAGVVFPSPRAWISQGLPGYAQASYIQNEKDRVSAIAYLQSHRTALIDAEKRNLAQGIDKGALHSLLNDPDQFYVQIKSMAVWWMLRDIVGEPAFTAALHAYNAADDKDAYYMQKLLEKQSHSDLAWFFDDWVYRDHGLPELRILSVYPRRLVEGGYMVTVTVENSGNAGVEVPVTLHMAEGVATDRLIVPAKSKASIRIRAAIYPQTVTVNDGSVPELNPADNGYTMPKLSTEN